ncbi:MAG: DeoR family transcriptional regulator [Candidatus Staskawiczbacteria bacterium]|nr:DeoR family transcriptional regulator [Candidatus Staskawiczbacteria bacterium]
MISERQEKLLNFLIKEYIATNEPVGSLSLKKASDLDVSAATIRNDLQALTEAGYIKQPHTSAGRVPTKKAYKYIADKITMSETFYDVREVNVVRMSIVRQIKEAHQQLEQEMQSLMEISGMLEISHTTESHTLFRALTILGPTREICEDNEDIIQKLLKELENF